MLRALRLTAILTFVGFLAGAVGGGLAYPIVELVISGPGLSPDLPVMDVLMGACRFGVPYGINAAPVLWWTLLREVPVWRGAAEVAFLTSFAASFTLPITLGNNWSALAMGIVGAALAVIRLKREFRIWD